MPTLAHGWPLEDRARQPQDVLREFLRPAVRAVPGALARRLGNCRITLLPSLGEAQSRWRWSSETQLDIELAVEDIDPHDVALELLLCLGQAFWDRALPAERTVWLRQLSEEVQAGVTGEIDEDALAEKRVLLSSRRLAASSRRLERYARASFAGTVAEYVHSLWHDVTVRSGPEHLPPEWLRQRLEMLARWLPPGRGYRLFP